MNLPASACAPWTFNLIGGWRDLDNFTPHEAHHSSRIMRTYHTHFGVPLGNTPGWWDDRKRNQKPVLPLYLRLDISSNLSRALSCLCLSGHNFLVQGMRHDRNRRPYELRICDRCGWHTSQDEKHFVGLCAWTSGHTSHTATAYLPTPVWGWPSSFEDLSELTWYFWSRLFCS